MNTSCYYLHFCAVARSHQMDLSSLILLFNIDCLNWFFIFAMSILLTTLSLLLLLLCGKFQKGGSGSEHMHRRAPASLCVCSWCSSGRSCQPTRLSAGDAHTQMLGICFFYFLFLYFYLCQFDKYKMLLVAHFRKKVFLSSF